MNKISVLPRNFNIILEFFYNTKFETEVKFDRFKIDFYNSKLSYNSFIKKSLNALTDNLLGAPGASIGL